MPPRKRKTSAELLAEIEADREREREYQAWLDSDPSLRRLASIDKNIDDPIETLIEQTRVICDHAAAHALRNQLAGTGKGLRECGFTELADEIDKLLAGIVQPRPLQEHTA